MDKNKVIVDSAFDLVNSYSPRQVNFMYNQMFWSGGSHDDYIDLNDDVGIRRRSNAVVRALILADDLGGQR
jgi:hypothetical protein